MPKEAILTLLSARASQELKRLLEDKHLYQHVTIDAGTILKREVEGEPPFGRAYLARWVVDELPKLRFVLYSQRLQNTLTLTPPNASLYCRICRRREAFAPVWTVDVPSPIIHGLRQIQLPDNFQMFSMVYECQRCFGRPEAFLVRREGWNLGLHGRSPIELVEVPKFIPNAEATFYRDSAIAFNSGKTLAALFYLRTFIEQFARRLTGRSGRVTGDQILDEYYKMLPVPVRDTMPSLREWYDKLSEALHAARADVSLFEEARTEIEKHFDIRRVFNVADGASAPAEEGCETEQGGATSDQANGLS